MASTLSVTPMTLFVVILSVNVGICRCGLKNQRNFAHVYGKRLSEESYGMRQNDQNTPKLPVFAGDFPDDYAPTDESYFLRRGEPNAKTKANVAHMFGRELYENVPVYDELDMYNEPEINEEAMVDIPANRDDVMIQIPVRNSDMHHKANNQQERFHLRDLLSDTQAVRMEALAYLDDILNNKRGKV